MGLERYVVDAVLIEKRRPTEIAKAHGISRSCFGPTTTVFQPVIKLVRKESVGQRTRKIYDRPTTPLQRVLSSGQTDGAKVRALTDLYTQVSPLTLKRQIDRRLAAMPVALEVSSSA